MTNAGQRTKAAISGPHRTMDGASLNPTRAFPRRAYEANVAYQCMERVEAGTTRDISQGGLFVATTDPCCIGDIITLLVPLDDEDSPLWATGKIRWIRDEYVEDSPPGMGVEFIALDARSKRLLGQLVRTTAISSVTGSA